MALKSRVLVFLSPGFGQCERRTEREKERKHCTTLTEAREKEKKCIKIN